MSLLKIPVEIVSLLVELLEVEDVFNMALSCRFLSCILYDRRMCRLALTKAPYSAEAQQVQTSDDYPKAFRKLAKRRLSVRAAEPWTVAIVAMADHFIYTNGHLCYTIENKQLRVLNTLQQTPTTELTVDVPLLLKLAVRDYDHLRPHTIEPLYCAEGVLSCLATQVLEDLTTCSWLIIFELREKPSWVVVQRPCSTHPIFVRNDKNYLFWGSRSHSTLEGSYRWGLHCLNLQTRQWSDSQLILWNFHGANIGSDICFEIIDGQFYCVSNVLKTRTENDTCNNFYQVVRFPVHDAVQARCEKPLMRNLWRRHDSEGMVDERWTSLQLSKSEKTGRVSIIEIRKEWCPGNAGSQRTCYNRELQFGPQEADHLQEPLLPTTPGSMEGGPIEEEWDSNAHIEERACKDFHVGDGPKDTKAYTLQECFVRSYNPSCNSFIDLVSEVCNQGSSMQLRVQSKEQGSPVKLWPRDQHPYHHDGVLAQLHGVVNPIQPIKGVEWSMDERVLVYSPTHMASGHLRPIVLISLDPGFLLPDFPNYRCCSGEVEYQPNSPSHMQETAIGPPNEILSPSSQGVDECSPASGEDKKADSNFIKVQPSLYRTMNMGSGNAHGFNMSYYTPSALNSVTWPRF
ncbi:hypothetical protein FVEN_g12464 [Fusarium venenatum]|uniref:F-box domain-containing protein n=1 Tax=Fusarium venenatum TaxID=56646 RepID=A0A2L2TMU8_9HYPO|nr:uncharacterized protein FVRRES_03463 [Fusarium venenatum]KAG8349321.1 hypothetical protein FVEN_g12464 [Fusarium venenatum]KAH7003515.1 hypothetical protein EDB82DRAFT_19375 [Fusarium venenatum]CEI66951.1 unnamed protein product [Fusarium venenatum]